MILICDAIKQNESEVEKYDVCLGYCLGFNLMKPPPPPPRD